MEELLIKIAEISPVLGILIWVVVYFKGEVQAKNDEIKELNSLLREQQKDTLVAINKMTDVVESLKDLINIKIK